MSFSENSGCLSYCNLFLSSHAIFSDALEKSEHYNVCSFSFPASTEWNYAIAV